MCNSSITFKNSWFFVLGRVLVFVSNSLNLFFSDSKISSLTLLWYLFRRFLNYSRISKNIVRSYSANLFLNFKNNLQFFGTNLLYLCLLRECLIPDIQLSLIYWQFAQLCQIRCLQIRKSVAHRSAQYLGFFSVILRTLSCLAS